MAKTKVQHKTSETPKAEPKKESGLKGSFLSLSTEEKICLGLLGLLILLVYSIRSNFLQIPFERDEGIYSYFGKLVLEGKTPYKDFYEIKFPGLFYFYALMVYLFGDTVSGMHTGFMYANIISMVFLYFAAKKLFSPAAGVIAAATFAFVSLTPSLSGFTVQSEHGVAFFTSMGLFFYACSKSSNKWYYFLLMGIAMGLAFMVKTTGVLMALWGGLIIILDFLFTKPKQLKQFLLNLGAYSLGGFAMIGIFFTIIFVKGSFSEMIYWTFEHSRAYGQAMPFEEGLKYFRYTRDAIILNYKFFWVHSMLAVGVCLLPTVNWKLKALAVTLLGFSLLTIVPGYFFYGHYWIQTIPGVALVSGLTFHCVMSFLEGKIKLKKIGLRYVYLIIFGLLTFNHVTSNKSYYFHPNYEMILRQTYGSNPFPEAMEIANFINANSKPEDNIVLIGSEPQIYFYTKKKCPSRHAYFTALVNNIPQHKEWQREFARDVEKAKPRYFVFFNNPVSLLVQANTDGYVFEWANKFVTENYNLVGCVDMPDGYSSTYAWKEKLVGFKPQGKNVIYIYERRS